MNADKRMSEHVLISLVRDGSFWDGIVSLKESELLPLKVEMQNGYARGVDVFCGLLQTLWTNRRTQKKESLKVCERTMETGDLW